MRCYAFLYLLYVSLHDTGTKHKPLFVSVLPPPPPPHPTPAETEARDKAEMDGKLAIKLQRVPRCECMCDLMSSPQANSIDQVLFGSC